MKTTYYNEKMAVCLQSNSRLDICTKAWQLIDKGYYPQNAKAPVPPQIVGGIDRDDKPTFTLWMHKGAK